MYCCIVLFQNHAQSKISIFKTVNSTFQSSTSNNLSVLCYFLPAETAGVDVNYLGCLGPQSSHRGVPDLQLSSNKSPNRRAQLPWIAPAKQQPSKRGREKPHFLLCWGENLPTTCGRGGGWWKKWNTRKKGHQQQTAQVEMRLRAPAFFFFFADFLSLWCDLPASQPRPRPKCCVVALGCLVWLGSGLSMRGMAFCEQKVGFRCQVCEELVSGAAGCGWREEEMIRCGFLGWRVMGLWQFKSD